MPVVLDPPTCLLAIKVPQPPLSMGAQKTVVFGLFVEHVSQEGNNISGRFLTTPCHQDDDYSPSAALLDEVHIVADLIEDAR